MKLYKVDLVQQIFILNKMLSYDSIIIFKMVLFRFLIEPYFTKQCAERAQKGAQFSEFWYSL